MTMQLIFQMACILKPECNFRHQYFRCLLPKETVDIEVKTKMMRSIHTFRRPDNTGQIVQPLEYKSPSLSIPNEENENIFRTRGKAWCPTPTATTYQHLIT